ncbi:MAG: hypothetical protein ACXABY_11425 [Candidatus Thorarchaeota archaeon]
MSFEEYQNVRRGRGSIKMLTVTILKDGRISLNKACFTEYFESYKYVILMFDRATNRIGLKPTNEARANACRIRPRKGGLAQIGAMAFLKFLGFPIGETKKYTCRWNEEEELLEVQLDI